MSYLRAPGVADTQRTVCPLHSLAPEAPRPGGVRRRTLVTFALACGIVLTWLAWPDADPRPTSGDAPSPRGLPGPEPAGCGLLIAEVVHRGGTRYVASGTARVPTGYHVWLLSHGDETERWWISVGEIVPTADSGTWEATFYHDGWHQSGETFRLALVAVEGKEQAALAAEWQRTQRNEENPIALPSRGCRPAVRTVIRGLGAPARAHPH